MTFNNNSSDMLKMTESPEIIDVSDKYLFHRSLIPLNGDDKLLVDSQRNVCDKLKNMVEFKFEGNIFAIKAMEIRKKQYLFDIENLEFHIEKFENDGEEYSLPYIKFLDKKDGKNKYFTTIYHTISRKTIKNAIPYLMPNSFYFLNDIYIPIINKETNKIEKLFINSSKKFSWKIEEKLFDNIEKIEIYENRIVLNGQNELELKIMDNIMFPFYEMNPLDYSGILHGFIFDNYLFKFDSMISEPLSIVFGSQKLEPEGNISVHKVKFEYFDPKRIIDWERAESNETYQILKTNNISKEDYKNFFTNLPNKSFNLYDNFVENEQKTNEELNELIKKHGSFGEAIFMMRNIMNKSECQKRSNI
jgi:hypothetical protein